MLPVCGSVGAEELIAKIYLKEHSFGGSLDHPPVNASGICATGLVG